MLLRKLSLLLFLGTGLVFFVSAQNARIPLPGLDPTSIILAHPEGKGLNASDVSDLAETSHHTSRHNGISHHYFQQQYQGIPIDGAVLQVHINRDEELVFLSQSLERKINNRINATQPALTFTQAFEKLRKELELDEDYASIQYESTYGPAQKTKFYAYELSHQPIHMQLVYREHAGMLHLCWNIRLWSMDEKNWWNAWVDAKDGTIYQLRDEVISCDFPHTHHNTSCAPAVMGSAQHTFHTHTVEDGSSYRVFPYPIESPNHGQQGRVFSPADSLASPFGWHDINAQPGPEYTITRGNNVWAKEDRSALNDANGQSPDGGLGLDFDFVIDSNQSIVAPVNQSAAITNLFYWNNLVHDVLYHYGFDEAAGNFQTNNYGRGGVGGDFVLADAQDGSGLNNANFATPIDGDNPRMQMYLWNVTDFLLSFDAPAELAGTYAAALSTYGPLLDTAVIAELVLVEGPGGANDACGVLQNAADLNGKVALIDRGNCFNSDKIRTAQAAGAIGVIMVQNEPGPPFQMVGNSSGIEIPSIMITQELGNQIKDILATQSLTVQLLDEGPARGFDSDFDAGVIVHEYGHGISIRLTGGAQNTGCLFNREQAGEGWSDWYGLVFTHRPGDTGPQPRGLATYLQDQEITDRGIRTYPYSTDMSINPSTYDDVKSLSVPHGVGSVMATMLWDMYWNLIEVYGYDPDLIGGNGGNKIALQLVTDGLKLQPCQPGFVDVRDAILLADELNYGGANHCLIWKTFARRGLGFSADQGSSTSRSDGTQAFDLPPQCQDTLYLTKTIKTLEAQRGDTLQYRFTHGNRTGNLLTDVVIRDTLPEGMRFIGSEGCAVTQQDNILEITIGAAANLSADTCTIEVVIEEDAAQSVWGEINPLETPGNTIGFQIISLAGSDTWNLTTTGARSGTRAFFVPNRGADNDQVLRMPTIIPQQGDVLSFWHRYNSEAGFDGGWVEFKLPGTEWLDLEPYFIKNGYNAGIASNNPAGARESFGGNSEGYIETWVDLTAFATSELDIRFRFASDNNTFAEGWWIDDIGMFQAESLTNTACISAAQGDAFCSTQAQPLYIMPVSPATSISQPAGPQSRDIKVYPIPTQQLLSLEVPNWDPGKVDIQLFTLVGSTVKRFGERPTDKGTILLDMAGIPAGVYLLQVSQGEVRQTRKVILQP